MAPWRHLPLPVRALGLLGGLVAVCIGLETLARYHAPQLPGWTSVSQSSMIMQGHATRLWGMTPGIKSNGNAQATINALGLRGEIPELPRPDGRQRILVLGDSAFFGHGIEDDETLAVQLAALLQERGLDVDVVNGAVSGYSIAQSALLMEEVGWDLQPTLVIYANLWSDNTWDAFHDEDLLRSRATARHNPFVHSAAMRYIAAWLTPHLPGEGNIVVWSADEGWPEDRIRRVPVDRYAALTDGVIRTGQQQGAGALFIKPSNRFLVDPTEPDTRLWDPYFVAMDAVADCHGVPVVDMTLPFVDANRPIEELFIDLMHPTAEGHRVLAEAVGAALLEAGWPATPLSGSTADCDYSGLTDRPPPDWFSDRGVGSPQAKLFSVDGIPVSATGADFEGEKQEAPMNPPNAP